MSRIVIIIAFIASPALAGRYHDHFTRDVAVGVAAGALAGPRYYVVPTPVATLTPSGPGSSVAVPVADEIAKMATLRDHGVLSEAEFQDQKSKLLGGK